MLDYMAVGRLCTSTEQATQKVPQLPDSSGSLLVSQPLHLRCEVRGHMTSGRVSGHTERSGLVEATARPVLCRPGVGPVYCQWLADGVPLAVACLTVDEQRTGQSRDQNADGERQVLALMECPKQEE